ncbi:hypothetical protein AVEN_126305-1 [Araneus ventricosus]|uniref:Uncharacterized protein n=1 Tax=Araneus ventricosus TaxID=182803 RepID=A0A4Y2I240_ARAVE|nr:hypothetical protein AVEN_126305-1 [Araneus ventricosus]
MEDGSNKRRKRRSLSGSRGKWDWSTVYALHIEMTCEKGVLQETLVVGASDLNSSSLKTPSRTGPHVAYRGKIILRPACSRNWPYYCKMANFTMQNRC